MTDPGGLPDDPRIEQAVSLAFDAWKSATWTKSTNLDAVRQMLAAALPELRAYFRAEAADELARQPEGYRGDDAYAEGGEMTDHDGSGEQRQKWTLADFRRHVPRIIAERDRAESALAERDATIQRVRELCAMVGGTAVFVRDVLTALDATGSDDDGDSP